MEASPSTISGSITPTADLLTNEPFKYILKFDPVNLIPNNGKIMIDVPASFGSIKSICRVISGLDDASCDGLTNKTVIIGNF